MKFTKWEIKRIRQALYLAIECEDSFIDAHQTGIRLRNGYIEHYVPTEHRNLVKRTQRHIEAFKKLLCKCRGV